VDDGDKRKWSQCTVTQVEEAKIILRMVPIFLSSILAYIPFSLLLSLTVQQGGTMDTHLGAMNIPPGSLFVVPIVFQVLILVVYDCAVVPWLRRVTGYAGGVTHLQRVAVGFICSAAALAIAAVVEGRRRRRASAGDPPMSAFVLTPQYLMIHRQLRSLLHPWHRVVAGELAHPGGQPRHRARRRRPWMARRS
jgi:hypothetical protein